MTHQPKGAMERLTAEDGHQFDCWIEPAQGERRGGLVILQEIFGVTDQLKGVAARYASKGYEVAIPALFDRAAPGLVVPFDDPAKGRETMQALKDGDTMRDVAATVAALSEGGGKVGVMGFCWGGGLALKAAQDLDIAAAVSFYGTRLGLIMGKPLRAPFQGHFGRTDDHTPAEIVEKLKETYPDAEIHLYDAGHAFANDQRPSHVPEAAQLAHERTAAFLARHLS